MLHVTGLSKSFPGVRALADVHLAFARAEVHALVGENGAGKSTLLKILAGMDRPDEGRIFFRGKPIQLRHPHQALQAGICMIHQELLPFPELTVAENIFMGREPAARWLGWINHRQMQRQARELLERLGVPLPPSRRMKTLTVAEMQTVEIAKALAHQAKVIIMDEPTSSLSSREVEALLDIIRDLKRRGVTVIYVSHKLDEIFRIADAVSVLRDGRHVATRPIAELDEKKLIALMVGREFSSLFPAAGAEPGPEILAVRGLRRAGEFSNIDLAVRQGEILGLAGLMGAGRTEVASAIFGLAPADAGEIRVRGRPVRIASPRDALRHGIALLSEDRKKFGLVLSMSVKQNITLASLTQCCRGWFIIPRRENNLAREQIQRLAIKCRSPDQPVRFLSGGNQQKIVLAKTLLTDPAILILDEPTRGIDINAKAEIYGLIRQLARQGKAILLISSELLELLSLSDRILVLRQGRIAAQLSPQVATQEEIIQHAMPR
jgi:inositol transport system ATP-binding protein